MGLLVVLTRTLKPASPMQVVTAISAESSDRTRVMVALVTYHSWPGLVALDSDERVVAAIPLLSDFSLEAEGVSSTDARAKVFHGNSCLSFHRSPRDRAELQDSQVSLRGMRAENKAALRLGSNVAWEKCKYEEPCANSQACVGTANGNE